MCSNARYCAVHGGLHPGTHRCPPGYLYPLDVHCLHFLCLWQQQLWHIQVLVHTVPSSVTSVYLDSNHRELAPTAGFNSKSCDQVSIGEPAEGSLHPDFPCPHALSMLNSPGGQALGKYCFIPAALSSCCFRGGGVPIDC